MPTSATVILTILLIVATSVWLGGMVAHIVTARVSSRVLPADLRVQLFRGIGKVYGSVGTTALVVGLVAGALLAWGKPHDGLFVATVVVSTVLVLATAAGIAQARAMTRLRTRALTSPGDPTLPAHVQRGAHRATVLRMGLMVLTLVLVVLGSALAQHG